MKNDPDINQTLLDQGADAVRRRHDGAQKFNGDFGRSAGRPFGARWPPRA